MSLSQWSLIYFTSYMILYVFLYRSVFVRATFVNNLITTIMWIVNLGVTLVYGIATQQIGFVLLFILTVVFISLAFSAAKVGGNDS